jgi:hypothetical protein
MDTLVVELGDNALVNLEAHLEVLGGAHRGAHGDKVGGTLEVHLHIHSEVYVEIVLSRTLK